MGNKILVVPGNTDLNRGDQALVWESIRLMDGVLPDMEVYLYEVGANQHERQLQKAQTKELGYTFLTRILEHPRAKSKKTTKDVNYSKYTYLQWAFAAIKDLCITSLLLVKSQTINRFAKRFLTSEQEETLEVFPRLSALVVKGGGFLHSYGKIRDSYLMYFFLFDVMLAHRYNVRTIILPNSIGPLKNKLARRLVKYVLSKVDYISVREDVSVKFVKNELRIPARKFPDLGFYLHSADMELGNYLKERGFDKNARNIAITLRPYRFDGHDNPEYLYNSYINEISKFVQIVVARGYNVSLVAHTLGPSAHEDDKRALKDVLNILEEKAKASVLYLEDYDLDSRQLQKLYSYFDLMVGTRFHSVIFALNVYVPAIAIAYGGNKSYGIMRDIGVDEYVIGIESVKSKILSKMIDSIEDNRSEYISKVRKYRTKLSELRDDMLSELKEIFIE